MSDNLFNAELHDADRYNEIQEQRATYDDYGDELNEHDLQIAQAQWEAEQHEAEWDAACGVFQKPKIIIRVVINKTKL